MNIPPEGGASSILAACNSENPTRFLDIIDLLLHSHDPWSHGANAANELRAILGLGGSVWTVAEDDRSLVERVSETEQKAYERALSPADEIAEEVRTAWGEVYGRKPDPSDAWDHAIKALEGALWPIITPNDKNARLGTIAGQLGAQPGQFTFRLTTSSNKSTNVETLVQMLRLIWPNPDRHENASKRTPTQEEAENVVQLAVLIIGWVRTGALVSTTV